MGMHSRYCQLIFCQTLGVKRDHLDLFFWALLLDMTFPGTHQLHGGMYVFIFYKVSFEKHSNAHCTVLDPTRLSQVYILNSSYPRL